MMDLAFTVFTVLPIGFVALAAVFTLAAWKTPGRAKWAGLAAIMQGYETNCDDVEAAAQALPDAKTR